MVRFVFHRFVAAALCFVTIALPASARAEWWEAESDHFIVKARASEKDAREYALELERFDRALRILQGMPVEEAVGRANKPTIYRFGQPAHIARIYGASGSGVTGFFISRAGDTVAFAPTRSAAEPIKSAHRTRSDVELDPRSVLFHEYTHYFMMQHFPGAYPRWYVEGFAEMLATMRVADDGSYHIGDPPQYRAHQIFQLNDFALDRMLDPDYRLRGIDALQHYATGWLLTHYLSFNTERLAQLRAYLRAIAEGQDGLEVARREFGDLDQLEAELRKYKNGPFPGIGLKTSAPEPIVQMRELTKAEEDAIDAEMQLARGVEDAAEGRRIASDVEKVVARHGDDPKLLALLAEAQIDARQFAKAEATGEKIVSLDPSSVDGWLARAAAADGLVSEDAAQAAQVRAYATKAAALDRSDPRPLILYYRSYIATGEEVPELAVQALETAYEFAGSDGGYRLLVARQMLVDGKFDIAHQVLMPIAFQGHKTAEPRDEDDPSLTRLLALVNEGNRDAGIQMIDRMIDMSENEDAAY